MLSTQNYDRLKEEITFNYKTNKNSNNLTINHNENKTKVSKSLSKIPLPFLGEIYNENCNAIRLNYGLYTQCNNSFKFNINGKQLCQTCFNQTKKNQNGLPTYGYIHDRIEQGVNFKDPKGKIPLLYGNVIQKLNITREEVEREENKLDIKIPEWHFEVKKASRGRPKKQTSTNDTSSEDGDSVKRSRGRPLKDKKEVKSVVNSYNIPENKNQDFKETITEELTKEQDKSKYSSPSNPEFKKQLSDDESDQDESSDDELSVELSVVEFRFKDKKYLKSMDNILYDIETHEEVGEWDDINKKVIIN